MLALRHQLRVLERQVRRPRWLVAKHPERLGRYRAVVTRQSQVDVDRGGKVLGLNPTEHVQLGYNPMLWIEFGERSAAYPPV